MVQRVKHPLNKCDKHFSHSQFLGGKQQICPFTLSRISALLVEASTMTPSFVPIPSISTRSWFNVCSSSLLSAQLLLQSHNTRKMLNYFRFSMSHELLQVLHVSLSGYGFHWAMTQSTIALAAIHCSFISHGYFSTCAKSHFHLKISRLDIRWFRLSSGHHSATDAAAINCWFCGRVQELQRQRLASGLDGNTSDVLCMSVGVLTYNDSSRYLSTTLVVFVD